VHGREPAPDRGPRYPFAILTNLPAVQGTTWGALAFAACSWSVHGGVLATFLFVLRVFRGDVPLVRAAIWGAGALLLLTALARRAWPSSASRARRPWPPTYGPPPGC